MGPDTLNRAITKLFGHEAGREKQPANKMGIWSTLLCMIFVVLAVPYLRHKERPAMWPSVA